jgi:hypothetical protein
MGKRLEKCDCQKIAVWCYMPSTDSKYNPYYCDDCVPRGCSCNRDVVIIVPNEPLETNLEYPEGEENVDWKWVDPYEGEETKFIDDNGVKHDFKIYSPIDEKGREYPCCEYDYDEEGYEIDDEPEIDKNL